jgi:hypothetical protein
LGSRSIFARCIRFCARHSCRASISLLAILQTACSKQPGTVLSHELVFQLKDSVNGAQQLYFRQPPALSQASVLIVGVGRGQASRFSADGDSPQPGFRQLGEAHHYSLWPKSGTAIYWRPLTSGDQLPRMWVTTPVEDEITAVTLAVEGNHIQDFSWVEQPEGWSTESASVVTTGKATLVAFWWGDADVGGRKLAFPGNGFARVEAILESGALVQCAVAVRQVDKAGRYAVTWHAYPKQGAQLWLIAIQ